MKYEFDVLLSYSSLDRVVVEKLAKKLDQDGVRVWFDVWMIKPGDPVYLSIQNALAASRLMLMFLSRNSLGADWPALEQGTAIFRDPTNKGRRFIPVRLDDSEFPGVLGQYSCIDYRQEGDKNYYKILDACKGEHNTQRSDQYRIYQHIALGCKLFRHDLKDNIDENLRKHIVISKSILVEAIEHALVDLRRMWVWHMPDDQPDRHKWAGFMAKWIAKMRPVQCSFNSSTKLPEAVTFLNAKLAVYIFQSFLNAPIPEVFYPHLKYNFYFRDPRGEDLALLAYCCEQIAEGILEKEKLEKVIQEKEELVRKASGCIAYPR
ncbi:MAG: toll/interleukin-1 receptor domain-containing protein [Magnetococcales bacterium]|nr:toll/interleukin-1 receptor domain-containing protein [Magnetococcales bacterium]